MTQHIDCASQPIGWPALNRLADIATQAGKAIMAVYATDFSHQQKDDASPVTEADLRADAVIRAALAQAFAGTPVVSEEHAALFAAETREFFLVDPLDGTKEFLARNGEFTVNVALIRDGRPVASVVGVPACGVLYLAAQGLGAFRRDAAGQVGLRVAAPAPGQPLRVIGSRSHAGAEMAAWLAQLSVPHVFMAAGSSLKFCRIAEGAADVYPRFGPTCQWDTAAGQCVLEQAGGSVTEPSGTPLRYGLERPLLNPYFIARGAVNHELS